MPDAAYYRDYRRRRKAAGKPVGRDRVRERRKLAPITFMDAVMILVVSESQDVGSESRLARRLMTDQSTLNSWTRGIRFPCADAIDALVDYLTLDKIRSTRAEARRILKADPAPSRLTPDRPPGPWLPREIRRA